jgi:hypothetical protein
MCDPAAGNGAGMCTACMDSATGNGMDLGCSASAPVCDPSSAGGAGACKACVDSAQGTGTDLGCGDTAPICNTAANGGRGVCRACLDSAQGTDTDQGCSATAPVCDTAAGGGAGMCRSCVDSAQGTGMDLGCGASSPICDVAASNGAGVCRSCADTAQGTGTDLGCGAGSPICDTAANSGTGQCKLCVDTSGPGSNTTDLGCSSPTSICDPTVGNGVGACKVCVATEGCPGSQTCNEAGNACEGCESDAACNPGTPYCRPTPPPSVCVECTEDTQCAATRPACSTATGFCGCTGDAQCAAAPGNTDFCDPAANNTRGECKVCVTDSNCLALDATRPFCDDQTACIQCRVHTDCQLSEVCNPTSKSCEPVPGATPEQSSAQIAAVLAASDGAVDLPIENTFVTYIKPMLGTDVAGFFLQSEPNGPAIFVSDTTALEMVEVGDRITLRVTSKVTTSGIRTASAVTGTTIISRGHPVQNPISDVRPGLVMDRSAASDVVTALTNYESEIITLTGTLASAASGSGNRHVAFNITTEGITTATGNFQLRVPDTLPEELELVQGCAFTLKAGPMWRFTSGTTNRAQPSAYSASDLILDCPAPRLLTARAMSPTEIRLTFDRKLNASTVQAADFTIGSLNVTEAVSDGAYRVTLTTDSQTAAQAYTVTVTGEVLDRAGKPVNPTANSAPFTGFTPPPTGPSLVINEIDYDLVGTDTNAEYIELYNRGTAAVDLSDIILLLVNGDAPADSPTAQRREYLRFPLTAVRDASGNSVTSLPPGGYILAAPSSYFTSTPPPASTLRLTIATGTGGMTDIVQNGSGDGIGLLQNSTGTLIDSVFYESGTQDPVFRITTGAGDRMLNFVEGTRTSAADSNLQPGSLQRQPNGSDSNNNDYDFAFLPNSPGAPSP